MNEFQKRLWVLFHPNYWVLTNPTSDIVDKWFNEKIDSGEKFKNIETCYATFDEKLIWIGNIPYGSFAIKGYVPKRYTIYKLVKLLEECKKEQNIKTGRQTLEEYLYNEKTN